jgi:hypothetical protein
MVPMILGVYQLLVQPIRQGLWSFVDVDALLAASISADVWEVVF